MHKKVFWTNPNYVRGGKLAEHIHAEYCIVGAGVSGLFAAYFLLEKGVQDIVVLEKDFVGSGSTGHSAGMLVGEIETGSWKHLVDTIGLSETKQYAQEQMEVLKLIVKIVRENRIDCDLEQDDLFSVGSGLHWKKFIVDDFAFRNHIHKEVTFMDDRHMQSEFNVRGFTMGERIEKSVSVNPLKFIQGFAKYLRKRGVRIYEKSPVLKTESSKVHLDKGSVTFSKLIDATGILQKNRFLENYITTICITVPFTDRDLKKYKLDDKDMFLTEPHKSYFYGKITKDNRLLVGYGDLKSTTKHYDTTIHDSHVTRIKNFIKTSFGENVAIEYAWSAPYALSKKSLPLLVVKDSHVLIGGAGTQVASIVNARRAIKILLK